MLRRSPARTRSRWARCAGEHRHDGHRLLRYDFFDAFFEFIDLPVFGNAAFRENTEHVAFVEHFMNPLVGGFENRRVFPL